MHRTWVAGGSCHAATVAGWVLVTGPGAQEGDGGIGPGGGAVVDALLARAFGAQHDPTVGADRDLLVVGGFIRSEERPPRDLCRGGW
ncbi:MAG TPA: hypothetical protein VE152_07060 [Acidimicrobiales bacterium]|nr:hypothetical protein [Acidimicrobiales bacterium]